MSKADDVAVVFRATYHGCVTITGQGSMEVLADALKRIKALTQSPKKCELSVSVFGVKIVDTSTNVLLLNFNIPQMIYSTVDPNDKKQVILVAKVPTGAQYCLLLSVKDKAIEIPTAIARTFQLVKAKGGVTTSVSDASRMAAGGSISFEVVWVGSAVLKETIRDDVIAAAKNIVLKKVQSQHPRLVSLQVSSDSVRVNDSRTGERIMADLIQAISLVIVVDVPGAIKDRDTLVYVALDVVNAQYICLVYQTPVGDAQRIHATFNAAFELVTEKTMRRDFDAFAPRGPTLVKNLAPALQSLLMPREKLKPVHAIGVGQFGVVYEATERMTGSQGAYDARRAVKLLHAGASAKEEEEFLKEAELMTRLEHMNLVRLIAVVLSDSPWLIVLEFMPYGDLKHLLKQCKSFKSLSLSNFEKFTFAQHVSAGLAYLHSKNILHRDVAARNCLVGPHNLVKLADFGLAKALNVGSSKLLMSGALQLPMTTVAIECIRDGIFSEASDCWAFGVLLWEIFTSGNTPYDDMATEDIITRVTAGYRLPKPEICDIGVYEVMLRCWDVEPRKRWKMIDLQDHLTQSISSLPPSKPRDVGAEVAALLTGARSFVDKTLHLDFHDGESAS